MKIGLSKVKMVIIADAGGRTKDIVTIGSTSVTKNKEGEIVLLIRESKGEQA